MVSETYEKVILPVAGARVGVVGTKQLTAAGPCTVHYYKPRIEEENLEMREETCLCKETHNNNKGLKDQNQQPPLNNGDELDKATPHHFLFRTMKGRNNRR
mgnify:FL=1